MDDLETQEKMQRLQETKPKMCQGGATLTERFEPEVQSVQVFLQSEGRPLQCRIELIQGPNNVKQVMEVYTEEGSTRPFYTIIETPGYGTGVVRIINSSTMEFPFTATVQPWDIGNADDDFDAQTTGGNPFFEISGGPQAMGIGNNLRSVGGESGDMDGMFGSFALAGSTSTSSTLGKSQGGGLAGLFDSAETSSSPSPVPPVQKKIVSPKTTAPPAPPVGSNMVSPKKSPPPASPVEREMVSPKKSLPEPEVEAEPVFLQNEEYANSSSKSSLSQESTPVIQTTARAKTSPKTSRDVAPPTPPPPAAPTTKRYVPPPPSPEPKRSARVLLEIDDAFK